MAVCNHPYCNKVSKRAHCGRHWFALPDDLRNRIKHSKSGSEKGAVLAECRAYFEERMIGRHEIVTCRGRAPDYDGGCGADIVWMITAKGKPMPVDVDSVERDDELFEFGKHIAHWATCPNAAEFRK